MEVHPDRTKQNANKPQKKKKMRGGNGRISYAPNRSTPPRPGNVRPTSVQVDLYLRGFIHPWSGARVGPAAALWRPRGRRRRWIGGEAMRRGEGDRLPPEECFGNTPQSRSQGTPAKKRFGGEHNLVLRKMAPVGVVHNCTGQLCCVLLLKQYVK